MDLAFLRANPATIDRLVEHQRIRVTGIGGGHTCVAERLTLDDGTDLFAKRRDGAPTDFFTAEAHGLRWLAEADGPPVPEVIAATPHMLLTTWVQPGASTPEAVEEFGRRLAALHRVGADTFGAPWRGYVGSLVLDNDPTPGWPEFYVERRLRPYLRQAHDAGVLGADDTRVVEAALGRVDQVAGDAEPPARVHGDLWSGNVHFGADGQAWLIDGGAAHGGHRETDLATLALFGAPHLSRLVAAYDEAYPLAGGWRDRVALHQLHLLLIHVVMFGAGYAGQALDAARRV